MGYKSAVKWVYFSSYIFVYRAGWHVPLSFHRAEVLSALDEDGDGKVDLQAGIQCPTPKMPT
jgi:hypothetical protein